MFENWSIKRKHHFQPFQPFSVWNKPVRFFGPRPEEEGERDRIRGSEIGMQFCVAVIDGRLPANQLRLVVGPIINKVIYIPGGCLGFLSHQEY